MLSISKLINLYMTPDEIIHEVFSVCFFFYIYEAEIDTQLKD